MKIGMDNRKSLSLFEKLGFAVTESSPVFCEVTLERSATMQDVTELLGFEPKICSYSQALDRTGRLGQISLIHVD